MKRLLLLRHAKSSWKTPGMPDFERPLNGRGRKAAPLMGAFLAARRARPDLVLCSAARRAEETWALAAQAYAEPPPLRHYRSLYLAPPARILALLQRQPAELETLLLVGHNPGLEHLAGKLAGPQSDPDALERLQAKFPTAALAEIVFEGEDWSCAGPGRGRLISFVLPKALP